MVVMLHFLWNSVAFIVALGVLITVHEAGHFLAARYYGVQVERFSIGFGMVLWSFKDKHNTEYTISVIPLGGYIKMLDDRIDNVDPEFYYKTFNHKTVFQRAIIIAAGPIFNFLFAVFSYWLVFLVGLPSYRLVVGSVTSNSIAAKAEIYPGMELKSIDGIQIPDWNSMRMQLADKIGKSKITLGVSLLQSQNIHQKILDLRGLQLDVNNKEQDAVVSIGIIPFDPYNIEPVLSKVEHGSAAMKAGLQVGDRIVKIDDKPINSWQSLVAIIRNNPSQTIKLGIDRYGNLIEVTLRLDSRLVGESKVEGFAGISPEITPISEEYKTYLRYSLVSSLVQASKKTWQLVHITGSMLNKFITGDVALNSLSGPLSIAKGAGISATHGLIYFLMFLALISINLGIINLLPLPVLDGGHLLFLAIEKTTGNPVSERIQKLSYRISSVILVLLMSLALFNDFSRL